MHAGNGIFAHARQASVPACAACGAIHHPGASNAPHESAQRHCLHVIEATLAQFRKKIFSD